MECVSFMVCGMREEGRKRGWCWFLINGVFYQSSKGWCEGEKGNFRVVLISEFWSILLIMRILVNSRGYFYRLELMNELMFTAVFHDFSWFLGVFVDFWLVDFLMKILDLWCTHRPSTCLSIFDVFFDYRYICPFSIYLSVFDMFVDYRYICRFSVYLSIIDIFGNFPYICRFSIKQMSFDDVFYFSIYWSIFNKSFDIQ